MASSDKTKTLANTSNRRKLRLAYESLLRQPALVNVKFAVLSGQSGTGKTTAIANLAATTDAYYVSASPNWTPATMLRDIIRELGAAPLHRTKDMEDAVIKILSETRRGLFVDEADYFFSHRSPASPAISTKGLAMLETLRVIHDRAESPIILVGMEHLEAKLAHREQLDRRISQRIRFGPMTEDDARTVADSCCGIHLDEDLLIEIFKQTQGSIGRFVLRLAEIEEVSKTQGWEAMTANQYAQIQRGKRGGMR
ncbi:ATP-binding protein [Funiculus sociatus GB1-A4]